MAKETAPALAKRVLRERLLRGAANGGPTLSEISRRLGHDRGHFSRRLSDRGGAVSFDEAAELLTEAGLDVAEFFAAVAAELRKEDEDAAVREFVDSAKWEALEKRIAMTEAELAALRRST
jgi:transposase-like protein